MQENTDSTHDATTATIATDVRNRVVPHQKAVFYATHQWLSHLFRHIENFARRPSHGRHLAKMSFPIPDLGSLETSFVDSFKVTASLQTDPAFVLVRYKCRGMARLNRVPQSKEAYFALRELLNQHGLEHKSAISSTVAKVQLDPVVPAEMRFSATPAEAAISATFKNVEGLGETSYKLSPHGTGSELLHAIEDLILGDGAQFMTRTSDLVSREERAALSKQLSERVREQARQHAEEEPSPGLFAILRRAFGKF